MMTAEITTPRPYGAEHDFRNTKGEFDLEVWEERVFRAAAERGGQFTTYRRLGHAKAYHDTFPAALADVMKEEQTLVYAVSPSGRFCNLPRQSWNKYAQIWIDIRGREVATRLSAAPPEANAACKQAHVLTINAIGEYAVYEGIVAQALGATPPASIARVIMMGRWLTRADAKKHFRQYLIDAPSLPSDGKFVAWRGE